MSIPFALAMAVRTFLASLRLAALTAFALGALPASADATTALPLPSCADAENGAIVVANATNNPICTPTLILFLSMFDMLETDLN
jgi:NAD/NADP transhydrogenase alpha subunit